MKLLSAASLALALAVLSPRPASAVAPAAPKFVAELAVDIGANTFLFHRKQTAFALELSPRLGLLLGDRLDFGLFFVAGYGGGIPSWAQSTMFGVGPYVGVRVPLSEHWQLMPWVGVPFHQTFMDGFTGGPYVDGNPELSVTSTRQIVRMDVHVDTIFRPRGRAALTLGLFAKTRLASFDDGLGQSNEIGYGLRLGATSYF